MHLRRASVGIPVLLENCHPFGDGAVAFEHNEQFQVSEGLRSDHAGFVRSYRSTAAPSR